MLALSMSKNGSIKLSRRSPISALGIKPLSIFWSSRKYLGNLALISYNLKHPLLAGLARGYGLARRLGFAVKENEEAFLSKLPNDPEPSYISVYLPSNSLCS